MRIMLTAIAVTLGATTATAQQPPAPFAAGMPLGVLAAGKHTPMSAGVRVYGGIVNAESCVWDATRGLILVVNRGASQMEAPNDGFVSLLNPDGSVHTARWIGATRDGLTLNHPFGSDIHAGRLYVADRDGGTADGAPSVSVVRVFDLATGAPLSAVTIAGSPGFNDIAVAGNGTIYATQTGSADGVTPMRLYKVAPDGAATILVEGAPLSRPNGVALDPRGDVVVVNVGDTAVLTFSPAGALIRTERSAQAGNDGLVILPSGVKYVSSVLEGGIARLAPGQPAQLIATGIPSAASMCLDPKTNQLAIPMNPNNAVALVKLR